MTSIVIDQSMVKILRQAVAGVRLEDAEGNVIGRFFPEVRLEEARGFESPFSDEEIERRSKDGVGRPLADILSDLRKQRP